MSVTREQVVVLLADKDWRSPFTTTDIAQALQVEEYAVRAAISWLCVAEVLKPVGATRRLDKWGRLYDAATYQWGGLTAIPKVRRNRAERAAAKEPVIDLECFNILLGLGRRRTCGG